MKAKWKSVFFFHSRFPLNHLYVQSSRRHRSRSPPLLVPVTHALSCSSVSEKQPLGRRKGKQTWNPMSCLTLNLVAFSLLICGFRWNAVSVGPGRDAATGHLSCVLIASRSHVRGWLDPSQLYLREGAGNIYIQGIKGITVEWCWGGAGAQHVFHFTDTCPLWFEDISAIPAPRTHPPVACTLGACLAPPLALRRLCCNKIKPPTQLMEWSPVDSKCHYHILQISRLLYQS